MNSDSQANCIGFAHPRVENNTDGTERMQQALAPYLVHAALAPNYDVQRESASEILHRAFDTSGQFADAGSEAEAVDRADRPVPRGFALKVDGSMPIDSSDRLRHTLAKWDQGLGTSMYAVHSVPEDLARGANDAKIAQLNAGAELPDIISPSHRVVLARAPSAFDNDEYALFVTANDVAAARQLYQYAAARAVSDSPLTVASLANSKEYELLQERSQCARDTLAQKYADALGIELQTGNYDDDNDDDGLRAVQTSKHYTIVPANQIAHGSAKSTVPQSGTREPEHFVIYNAATPVFSAASADQGVLLSHGVMGGVTRLTNTGENGWHQPHFLSLMPQSTAAAFDDHTQLSATHRKESERAQQAFESRVAWRSDYDNLLHVNADERHDSLDDPYSQRWLDRLSPSSGKPLRQQRFTMVTAQLPSISTIYASPAQLGMLARLAGNPANIAVALDNEIVPRITTMWDSTVRPNKYPMDLRQVFANAYNEDGRDGFGALSRQSTCRNTQHSHAVNPRDLYADAQQYNVSQTTGNYKDTRQFVTGDYESRTVLSMDKQLIRMLTPEATPQ